MEGIYNTITKAELACALCSIYSKSKWSGLYGVTRRKHVQLDKSLLKRSRPKMFTINIILLIIKNL